MRIMKFSGAFLILFQLSIGFKVDCPTTTKPTILELVDSIEEKSHELENTTPTKKKNILKRNPSIVNIGDLSTPPIIIPENKNIGVLGIPQIDIHLSNNSIVEFLVEMKSILSESIADKI